MSNTFDEIDSYQTDINLPMAFHRLRYFVAVAEERHFGRASLRLGIAQPPLSQQIVKLERSLGMRLLRRTTRRVELTEAGEVLLETARAVLLRLRKGVAAAERASRGEIGSLTIGFPASLALSLLPEVIRRHRKKAPDVKLHLREMTTTAQIEALRNGLIDVAFLREARPRDPDLTTESIASEPFIAVLPSRHARASQKRVALSALRHEPFVLFPRAAGPEFYDRIVSLCNAAGFQPRIAQEAVEWQTVVSLVGAGLGVSVAPQCVERLKWPNVAFRAISPGSERTVVSLCHLAATATPVFAAFKALVRETVAETQRG